VAQNINVASPEFDYTIKIGSGLLDKIGEYVPAAPSVVITNTTVASFYGKRLPQLLPNSSVITMPDGEQYKTLETVNGLYPELVTAGLDRSGTIMALGGGVVGDTAGFVAATYMRGVRFVQIPTTLLAMVDSSVGGKVGVDLPQGKNLVGAFKQPEVVIIDPDVLATLPEREWRCGMAEVIKHGFIADEQLLQPELWDKTQAEILIARAVAVKVKIVQEDPYEKTVRAYLNLGHTFAHAIERVSQYSWPHGEAVGVGLVAAARLSYVLGLCSAELSEKVEKVVSTVGLPTRIGDLDPAELFAAMGSDKKWQAGHSRFVLLKAIGQPVIAHDVEAGVVIETLRQLKS